ncbi:hypothetical protein BaRGS_00001483 [Batillaria attramentaria]|uniref:Chitobiosyldiphosphodolichol beta-mannosyltransferase n=1 Tax=Batillaria attramentaria TaxID=370345 RepID=A0ABD0M706_9CAEN
MLFSVQILLLTPIVFLILYLLLNYFVKGERCVCIVVLGDIGRSPRMQYHAMSLAQHGYFVHIVGYRGSTPHKKLRNDERIEINHIREAPSFFRLLWTSANLAFTLLLLPKSGHYFVQNPPTIPTFVVVWFVSVVRRSQMIIDWHNYGYTILALKLGPQHLLVSVSQWVERTFGKYAKDNICVTNAMRDDLHHQWNVRATTVYDRPPEMFKPTPTPEQHDLFLRLAKEYPVFKARSASDSATAFTQRDANGAVTKSADRSALVVSSTSWTEDEDFGLLLKALEIYEKDSSGTTPSIVCVITGKGPQKEMYREKIKNLHWKKVQFCLPWLTAEDYPLLLGSADLGVCLHMSSSGLDLPMKVVDMFGCGLPVCAVRYNCVEELVKPGVNGLLFDDSTQLAAQLQELLKEFPCKSSKLDTFRENLQAFQAKRWHDQWTEKVLPIFVDKQKVQ